MDTINEIEAAQRAAQRQIREDAELFGQLMKHKGWPRYMALVEAIAQNYHSTIMKPLDSVLEATKPEFAKGVLSGLTLATAIPQLKINEAHELRRPSEDE
jgi:DNA-binding FadR family transcriptional regulator